MSHVLYRTKRDGKCHGLYFHTEAKTWKGICRQAHRKIEQESFFDKGTTLGPNDYEILTVNGNAE